MHYNVKQHKTDAGFKQMIKNWQLTVICRRVGMRRKQGTVYLNKKKEFLMLKQ